MPTPHLPLHGNTDLVNNGSSGGSTGSTGGTGGGSTGGTNDGTSTPPPSVTITPQNVFFGELKPEIVFGPIEATVSGGITPVSITWSVFSSDDPLDLFLTVAPDNLSTTILARVPGQNYGTFRGSVRVVVEDNIGRTDLQTIEIEVFQFEDLEELFQ